MSNIDWDKIHSLNWVSEPDCWKKCGDGFCCSNNRPEFGFRFLPQGHNTIIYLKEEYEWLLSQGNAEGVEVKPLNLIIDGVTVIELYQADCRYLGLCKGHIERPLLCKIYPYLPVIDGGRVIDLLPASLFDITAEAVDLSIPCAIRDDKAKKMAEWNRSIEILEVLNQPKLIFYFQSISILIASYQKSIKNWSHSPGLNQLNFWKRWEVEFFKKSFHPFNKEENNIILENYHLYLNNGPVK